MTDQHKYNPYDSGDPDLDAEDCPTQQLERDRNWCVSCDYKICKCNTTDSKGYPYNN